MVVFRNVGEREGVLEILKGF